MVTKKEQATVATPSLAYSEMCPYWDKVDTVLAGTQAMRDARERMAPRHQSETDTNYGDRINSNVLFNATDLALRTWVGKPFSNEIQYEAFPAFMTPWMDDVNLEGDDLNVFARKWFEIGVSHAFCHVLVDFPKVIQEGRTALDDIREGVRPYCVLVRPENLFFATSMRIGNEEMLTHVRIREYVTEVMGWEEVTVEQIKVYTLETVILEDGSTEYLVQVGVYRKNEDSKGKEKEWYIYDSWYMDIPFIPVVTFYANRSGFMLGKSPLADLVDLNIRHWQSTSDQINILTVARFPILALAGGSDEHGDLVIGPKEFLFTDDPSARFYYVEHRGAAIEAGNKDLRALEEQMKSYGAEFMKDRPDRETATSRSLDTAESTSPLLDAVYRFNDAMNYMLWMMARWVDQEYTGKAFVPKGFAYGEVEVKEGKETQE